MELGVIGLGYWGPNIVRNGVENSKISQIHVYDMDDSRLKFIKNKYRGVKICKSYAEMLSNENIEAIAVITPVSTHYEVAKKALEAGKHLIVEKPFTASVAEADEIMNLANKKNATVLVDHTFIYTSAVTKLKELILNNNLGDIYYYDSVRVNLGKFQNDVNVIWDLAPHDFSIMDYLIQSKPVSLSAMGGVHIDKNGIEDVAYVHLNFDNGLVAHFHLNWLSPVKVRKVLIGASKKMIEYNDLEADNKIKVYDKGVDVNNKEYAYKTLVQYRTGDMYAPKVDNIEALSVMLDHFVDCVENHRKPLTDMESGLRVVQLLEASQRSIKRNGEVMEVK